MPHTISTAITARLKIDNLNELPEDKRPPRDLWWKPYKLKQWLDDVFGGTGSEKPKDYVELNFEEAE